MMKTWNITADTNYFNRVTRRLHWSRHMKDEEHNHIVKNAVLFISNHSKGGT